MKKIERTLSIIKPDAVTKNLIGAIYHRLEAAGLRIAAAKMLHLSRQQAEKFYDIHKERPFFSDLVEFISSGPIMVQVLEGENAILKHREIMGATDPKKAAVGTIRADFAESIDRNAVHGSDAPETASVEIAFFFEEMDIIPRHHNHNHKHDQQHHTDDNQQHQHKHDLRNHADDHQQQHHKHEQQHHTEHKHHGHHEHCHKDACKRSTCKSTKDKKK